MGSQCRWPFFPTRSSIFLFSSAYRPAAPLLALLIWAGLFTGLGAARDIFVISKNWTRVNLVSVALGSALNIVLNYLLIPR